MKRGWLLGVLLLSSFAFAANQEALLRAANSAAQAQELRQMLGSSAIVLVKSEQQNAYLRWDGNSFSATSAATPDYTITSTDSAVRSLQNAVDKSVQFKCLLAKNGVVVTAANPVKQAAIRSAVSAQASCEAKQNWPVTPKNLFYSKEATGRFGIFFAKPPGALARNPGLIYDTVSNSPNAMGPWNVFKINPGLIGPNDILRQNPGLIGPADMAIINPNLHGPAEYAHMMGIGAYSNSAQAIANSPKLNLNFGPFSTVNRWGNRR